MINYTGTYTDQYQLTMAQVYYLKGQKNTTAIFDYFFRKLPFDGGYAVFAGLETLLSTLDALSFDEKDIAFIRKQGFHPEFINYLKHFKFSGNIYSVKEGDLIFPTRPVLIVEATIIEAQIIETLLLNILNFQTLIATKASRIRQVAGDRILFDFGLRRAQGAGGYHAARAAFIGGFNATSDVRASCDFDIPVSGTMSHSFIQSYDREIDAFRDFSKIWPDNTILLVDTYDTLESGLPNTIQIGKEMKERGKNLKGVRLDSGDLVHLAKESRRMLDEAGLPHVQITASNQLDEYVIQYLINQGAPIDVFGVGTNLVIGRPDAALDGVYKLAFSGNKHRIKLSESVEKITLPCKKQVFRTIDDQGKFNGLDIVGLAGEERIKTVYHPFESDRYWSVGSKNQLEPLLNPVIENGQRNKSPERLSDIAEYSQKRLSQLPPEYKPLKNPQCYTVSLSEKLHSIRDQLIKEHKKDNE